MERKKVRERKNFCENFFFPSARCLHAHFILLRLSSTQKVADWCAVCTVDKEVSTVDTNRVFHSPH